MIELVTTAKREHLVDTGEVMPYGRERIVLYDGVRYGVSEFCWQNGQDELDLYSRPENK